MPSATDLTSGGTVLNEAWTVGVVVDIIGKRRSAKIPRNGYILQCLQDLSGAQLPEVAVPKGSEVSLLGIALGMQLHSFRNTFPFASGK